MKIVNLEKFLSLPKGTVYSKYSPCCFEGLMVKDDNCNKNDFFYQDLIGNIDNTDTGDFFFKCEQAERLGQSLKLDFEVVSRDGMFERYQLFAIYEEEDLKSLIKILSTGI